MRLARLALLIVAAANFAGCATYSTFDLAAPDDEGSVREYKYGIYDAPEVWRNDEGFVVVCIVGEALGKENSVYSLVLRTTASGVPQGQIWRDRTNQKILPEYRMAPRELGEPCEYSPHGRSVPLIPLELPEPEYYEHTPVHKAELVKLLESQERPRGLAVVGLKRAEYCTEVIIWNPDAEATIDEFVRISTPTEGRKITGNRAWYVLTPFAVLFDIATFPIQVPISAYLFARAYGKAHMPHC